MPIPRKVGPATVWMHAGKAVRVALPVRDGVVRYTVGDTSSLRVVRSKGRGTRYPSGSERGRLMDRVLGYIAAAGTQRKRSRGKA